ncbi:hypothetical protein BDW22DRAFT_1133220 [Trametopsis cervina]|nr:hypothetical protein BDW22DRAFT_1133220 [Trametopsis cervina]
MISILGRSDNRKPTYLTLYLWPLPLSSTTTSTNLFSARTTIHDYSHHTLSSDSVAFAHSLSSLIKISNTLYSPLSSLSLIALRTGHLSLTSPHLSSSLNINHLLSPDTPITLLPMITTQARSLPSLPFLFSPLLSVSFFSPPLAASRNPFYVQTIYSISSSGTTMHTHPS